MRRLVASLICAGSGKRSAHRLSLGLGTAPAFSGAGALGHARHRQAAEYRQHQEAAGIHFC
jgi:hypothetical protein